MDSGVVNLDLKGAIPKTKCEKLNMEHAWADITNHNICYPTDPPQYPPIKERCMNCGLVRIQHQKKEEWWEYSWENVNAPV